VAKLPGIGLPPDALEKTSTAVRIPVCSASAAARKVQVADEDPRYLIVRAQGLGRELAQTANILERTGEHRRQTLESDSLAWECNPFAQRYRKQFGEDALDLVRLKK
jgi:hypothetical protein